MSNLAAPVSEPQRFALLDGLRGFALAGVLLANLTAFSLYYFLPHADAPTHGWRLANLLLDPALRVLVYNKFISLFSIMFGLGFALQMERAGDDPARLRRYGRRLCVLLVIGLLHAYLVWWGDVLRYYAAIGLLLLALRRLPARGLALLGVAIAVLPYAWWSAFGDWPATLAMPRERMFAGVLPGLSGTRLTDVLHANATLAHWWFAGHWSQIPWILGCQLIGLAIGRCGLIHTPSAPPWKALSNVVLPAALIVAVVMGVADYRGWPMLERWQSQPLSNALLGTLRDADVLALALGYMGAFVRICASPFGRLPLSWLAPVGRMALSHYLTQSVLGVLLFYDVGLGIGPRFGLAGVFIACGVIFGAQILVSRWWLARFRFGPAEWAWRSLTYGRAQPMRLPMPLSAPARDG